MYRIMIVDDEILVRVGLKSTVDWNALGFEIIGEAANGEQAYEMFLKLEPDVILTDIKMPRMDGLKLTELVKAKNPKVRVIILTCYDDFAYAREALKHGASNYILKSEIEDDELINLLKSIQGELDSERGKIDRYSMLQRQINSNINVLKEKLLSDLLDSKVMADNDFYTKCEIMDLSIRDKNYLLAVLYKDNVEDFVNYSDRDWQLLDSGILNIAMEILNEKDMSFLISSKGNCFTILLIKDRIQFSEIEALMERIRDSILKYLNIWVSIVLSSEFKLVSQAANVYKECEKASQMMFYNNKGSIIYSRRIDSREINIIELREAYTKPLLNFMDEEDLPKANEILVNIENALAEKHTSPVQAKLYYISLVNDILEHYYGCISDEHEVNDYANYSNLILNSTRIANITRLVKIFIDGVINLIKENRMKNSKYIIHQAKSYIEKNFEKKISLESLASHINLSKQYLCYIFKRETGENVSVYINKIRVEKAKDLIKKYDYKVKELFDKVGFSDQQYFCKTFKKVTGITIAEYKEEILKKARGL